MMSDDRNLPKSKLKCDGLIDPESGYSKMFKNKMENRRTFYKMLILLILVLSVVIVAVYGLSLTYLKMTEVQRQTCTTKYCLRSATTLVESMNKSVDPCEDFYQFACGNYANLHARPKNYISINRFNELHDTLSVIIRNFMERADSDNESSSVSKSIRFYRSCLVTDEMNTAHGIKQLVQILDKIGLTCMVISNRQDGSNLSSILARLKKNINLDYLFAANVKPDTKNRSTNRISLGKPSGINKFRFNKNKTTENIYKMSSRKTRETLETEKKSGNTDREEYADRNDDYFKSYKKYFSGVLEEIYKFQSNDCEIYRQSVKNENISQLLRFRDEYFKINDAIHNSDIEHPLVMTVDELQNQTNHITQSFTKTNEQIIDWKQYLTILFMDVENVTLDFETDLIQISNIKYFIALFELISKHKDQIFFNIYWEVIYTLLPYTTNEMRFIQDRFDYETTGLEKNPSKSLHCADAVNSMMGMAVARLLLDIEPINNNMKMVAEMMKNIHWAFEKIVKELDWMDDTTKQRTLRKAQQMKTLVGFPEFINDSVQLDKYYSDFEVIENDYFGNAIRYLRRDLNYSLVGLEELDKYTMNSWAIDPLEVNAYSWYQANAITIPAGILRFPFFGHDLQSLNYGFLGFILGHELTHGFDNTGRKFDHEGNENMWWTNHTIEEYEKRSDCFIQHYDSYVIPGIEKKTNGKKTLDENIADNGGLREALWAYRKFVNDNGEEPNLPGLEQYSSEQIFYLAYANNVCEATTRKRQLIINIIDNHSPNSIRVNAGVTNSDEFSQVWNCKKGSKMNPENEKCKIW